VSVYDAGTGADTTYSYDTTSGQLTQRDFPTVSSRWIRTAYSYDAARRLEFGGTGALAGGRSVGGGACSMDCGTTDLYKTPVAAAPAAGLLRG
jgi:hypothetical protein